MTGADLIIAGEVADIAFRGPPRLDHGVQIQEWLVTINVASVLKGVTAERKLTYVLNNYRPGLGQNGNFEMLYPGDTRIFFLIRYGSLLRAISDLYGTSILVPDLAIPQGFPGDTSLGETIASLLLNPSTDSTSQFASAIPNVTPLALKAAGYSYVESLLLDLMRAKTTGISREACLVYYAELFGSPKCLQRLQEEGDERLPKRRVEEVVRRRQSMDALLSDSLRSKDAASRLLQLYAVGVDRGDAAGAIAFLKYVSKNSDPVLRASANQGLSDTSLEEVRPGRPPVKR
jgi:hypothetical protein